MRYPLQLDGRERASAEHLLFASHLTRILCRVIIIIIIIIIIGRTQHILFTVILRQIYDKGPFN